MDIQQTSTSTGTTAASSATSSDDSRKTTISSDFETFLKMLTTQMQNQDPLNPVDSSDYAVQLATFSGVEQQVLTNQLLGDLTGGGGLSGLADLAAWVGMEARVQGTEINFDGSPMDIHFTVPPSAQKTELVISTPVGQEIRRIDVTGQTSPYTLTEASGADASLLAGSYNAEVIHHDSGGALTTATVETYAGVNEVRAGSNGAEVVLADGRVLSASDVTALRTP